MLKKSKTQSNAKRIREAFSKWLAGQGFKCAVVVAVGTVLLAVIFGAAITPEKYNLKVGSIAFETITASKDVVDEVTTSSRRETAARQVEPIYHPAEGVSDEVLKELSAIFLELGGVQNYGATKLTEKGADYVFAQGDVDFAKDMLTRVTLSDYQLKSLMQSSADAFSAMTQAVTAAVRNTLNTTIREGQVNESIQTILQIAGFRVETNLLQNVVTPVLRKCIKPNMVIEESTTEAARQTARDEVEPVVYVQGQNIIRAGERVALNQMEMLRQLGLLDDNSVDMAMYTGAVMIVLIGVGCMLVLLQMSRHAVLKQLRRTMALMLVIVGTVGVCVVIMRAANTYLVPVAMCAMLLTGLMGGTVGIAGGVCAAIIVSALTTGSTSSYAPQMVVLLLMGVTGSVLSSAFLRRKPQRVRVVICGLLVALCQAAIVFAMGLMNNSELKTVWSNGLWTIGSGFLAAMLTLGLQPLFETAFSLSTPSKLLELTNPNHPLLKKLLMEAPGTYHHSLLVANLAEAAAEAIGASTLLTRAGAYYHDVGKLKRPLYFKENQQGENMHDNTDPNVSAAILTAHTGDGLQLAQKYRLPTEIQRIIQEHHGDAPVMYFYHKALQQSDGKPVDIQDFRYDNNRPSTKESAIVMLADTVEAAVRSMQDPTPKAIENMIERLIRGKLEDGQLSECPLTLSDIDKISAAFINSLNGAFHERIEYPQVHLPKREVIQAEEPKAQEPKAEEPKAEEPKQEEEKPEEPKQEEEKQEVQSEN